MGGEGRRGNGPDGAGRSRGVPEPVREAGSADGERLYSGRPPRYVTGTESGKDGEAAVIGLAEERALFVRTGHHSAHTGEFRDGAGAVAALFPQHDNRNGEPNLHVHTVLLNRALRADQGTSGDRKWRGSGWQAKPAQPRNVNRWFDARCKRYGVRRITVHDTRRACGSLLAALDVHPRVAMAILRHSRMAMTMEIYTQVPDKATRDALRRLSAELDEQPAAQDAAADDDGPAG
jgi:hypothetical protein